MFGPMDDHCCSPAILHWFYILLWQFVLMECSRFTLRCCVFSDDVVSDCSKRFWWCWVAHYWAWSQDLIIYPSHQYCKQQNHRWRHCYPSPPTLVPLPPSHSIPSLCIHVNTIPSANTSINLLIICSLYKHTFPKTCYVWSPPASMFRQWPKIFRRLQTLQSERTCKHWFLMWRVCQLCRCSRYLYVYEMCADINTVKPLPNMDTTGTTKLVLIGKMSLFQGKSCTCDSSQKYVT